MTTLMLTGLQVYTPHGVIPVGSVKIENGLIQAVDNAVACSLPVISDEVLRFPSSYHLVPGFIDMHVHGANGHDVMDATADAIIGMSQAQAKEGTTAFLATTMTAGIAQIEKALKCVQQHIRGSIPYGAEVLGVHLEGPFLAASKMGAQSGDNIIAPDISLIQKWQKLSNAAIKLVTVAPEHPASLEFITFLTQQNIISSLGHSNATYEEALKAIAAGASHATHLFNAMRPIHHREPGLVVAALLADTVLVELIVDGIHLHPAMVEMVLKTKGQDKIILVTDAMRAKCLGDGCYELGGQMVRVKDGRAELTDGTLAGSVLSMSSAVKNMLRFSRCTVMDAIKMASENPAKALSVFDRKGSISIEKDADLVVLDHEFNVVLTLCKGVIIPCSVSAAE